MPDSAFVRDVARALGGALALTSANTSGAPSRRGRGFLALLLAAQALYPLLTRPPSLSVGEFEHLWPSCGAVFDGGALPPDRRGSTVVDLSQEGTFAVLRDGTALRRVTETALAHGLQQRTV